MNDLRFDDPCVLFALARESRFFRKEFPPTQRFPGAPCRARFCGPAWLSVLILETGVGHERARIALDWLLSNPTFGGVPYEPKLVLFAGFAGALSPDLKVGDLVLADAVADAAGNVWPTTWPGELPGGPWRPPMRRGLILSSPHLVGGFGEKRRLGEQHEALAVDMESASLAQTCSRGGVPFGCLRAISDEVETPMSAELIDVLSGGQVAWGRLFLTLVRRPSLLKEMLRLGRDTRLAARQLGTGLGELLTLTLPAS